MTATRDHADVFGIDTEIDIAITDQDEDERQALGLAHRIRTVAGADPALAQELVDQLIVSLDQVLGGTFREQLDGVTRAMAERALVNRSKGAGPDLLPSTDS